MKNSHHCILVFCVFTRTSADRNTVWLWQAAGWKLIKFNRVKSRVRRIYHSWLVGKIHMFFQVAVLGCIILWYILLVSPNQDLRLLSLTGYPPVQLTRTNTHTLNPLSCSLSPPTDCTIHHLPMNLSSSTSTLHFCASLSVTLLLPSISSHPSLLCQVSRVLTYTETCSCFLILPVWTEIVILGKLTNALM